MKWFLLCLLAAPLAAQQWSGIIDPARAIDWSQAGSAQINDVRTLCVTSACNTVSGGTVTASSINTALASMSAHTYLQIPAGTFSLSNNIQCNASSGCSNLTIRGMGPNSTFLTFTGANGSGSCANHSICFGSSDINYQGGPSNTATISGCSLTSTITAGTFVQGCTFLSLSSTTNLATNSLMVIDQIDDQADTGGFYVGCEIGSNTINPGSATGDPSGACYPGALINGLERGSSSLATIRGQQQMVNVVGITGSVVQITPGLYAPNWSAAKSPGAWWATHPVFNDGVENLSEDLTAITSSNQNGITFFNCTGCWIRGIRSVTTSNGGTGWYHAQFSVSNHGTFRDSYHSGANGDAYGFTVSIGSDNLIENNIGQYPGEDAFYNSDCEGCVADYNFAVDTLFTLQANWLEQGSDYHGVQLYSLFEGNVGAGMYADAFHGSHDNNTYFRNRWDGRERNGSSIPTQNTSVMLVSGARYNNIIGNILGTPSYHTVYKATPTSNSTNGFHATINCGVYTSTGTFDSLCPATSMFWGNYDTVTNAVRWCGNSSDPGWSTTCGSVSEVPTSIPLGQNFITQIGTGDGTTTTFSATLPNTPLFVGNSSAYACLGTCTHATYATFANDNANGVFANTGSSGTLTGTINYTTGAVSLTFGAAPASGAAVYVNYLQNTGTTGGYPNPVPATTTLPASFIYASQPSWWPSGKAWPPIGPDVTGGNVGQCIGGTYSSSEITTSQNSQCTGGTFTAMPTVVSIPAVDCYFNVMGGTLAGNTTALAFDAGTCYNSATVTPYGFTGTTMIGITIP
jgi:hypothetical protein